MDLPTQALVEEALRQLLQSIGKEIRPKDAYSILADKFGLSVEQRNRLIPGTKKRHWENRVQWARQRLVTTGEMSKQTHNLWFLDSPWSDIEVKELVSDYFSMLNDELLGQKYNKTAHRERLMKTVLRSNGAIERKHQNVSAILHKLGYPWIQGYKPLKNAQEALTQEVLRQLQAGEHRPAEFLAKPKVTRETLDIVFVDRPDGKDTKTQARNNKFVARKVDFAAIDARNLELGSAGEKFVVDVEKRRLRDLGLHKQAKLVRWVARDDGDGLGYDILSYDENAEEIFIEVKTTRADSYAPFYLTETERLAAIMKAERYRLYRVFRFGSRPMIYVLRGPLEAVVRLEPTAYRVSILPSENPSMISAGQGE